MAGRPFTADELGGFDLAALLGVPAAVTVEHKDRSAGVAEHVAAINTLGRANCAALPGAANDLVIYSPLDPDPAALALLPEWIQEKVKASPEFQGPGKADQGDAETKGPAALLDDDEIPF